MTNPILNITVDDKIESNPKVNIFEVELEFASSDNATYQDLTLFYKESSKEELIKDLNVLEKCENAFPHGMIKGDDYYSVEGFNSKSHGVQNIEQLKSEKPFFKHWEVLFPEDKFKQNNTAHLAGISVWYYNHSGDKFHVNLER